MFSERSIFSSLTELFTGDTTSEERKLCLQLSKQMLIQRLQNSLRDVVKNIALMKTDEILPLHNDSPGVETLLALIEACFSHGLKPQAVVSNDCPLDYWDFICTLRASSDAIANATLDMIATTSHVRSTYGRCRAWIRKLINQKALEYNVRMLTSDTNVTQLWYHENALMAETESASLFTSVITALNEIGFELQIDDPSLENSVQMTTISMVSQSGLRAVNTAYRTSGTKDGVKRFENDRGLEIFRSEVKGSGKELGKPTKRWFIGDSNRRVAVYYANVPSNQPPYDGWVVHPSGGTAPTPKVVTFEVPKLSVAKKQNIKSESNIDKNNKTMDKNGGMQQQEEEEEKEEGGGEKEKEQQQPIHIKATTKKEKVVQIETVVPTK